MAVLALGSFAVITGFGAPSAGAATPDNLISNAQYDQLWEGMTEPALSAFLAKSLTVAEWGTLEYPNGTVVNYQLWEWDASFGNCRQDTVFLFTDADGSGTPYPAMQLTDWGQQQTPECEGIVK